MKYYKKFLSALPFLFALSLFSGNVPCKDYVEGEVLVRFKEHVTGAQNKETVRSLNLSVHRKFKVVKNLYHFKLPVGTGVMQAVQELSADPDVLYAEPNYIYHALDVPNDPGYDSQWGLPKINAPAAWETNKGSSDVIIAVIDTGVDYKHPDLAANMWVNQAEYEGVPEVDDDGNGIVDDIYGASWIDGTVNSDPMDDNSHGTHCAGIMGAVGDNGIGICGVNWNVRIMALKFLDNSGHGTIADAIKCIEYVIERHDDYSENIVALSNSWGGFNYSQNLYSVIEQLNSRNILFVAAAGNEGNDADVIPMYPAAYALPNIISVANSNQNDNRSSFSNYGKYSVDIASPGSSIYSTIPTDPENPNEGRYGYKSGTSMATPFVSGAAGILSARTGVSDYTQLKEWILKGATRLHQWTNLTVTGGRLNLAESLRVAELPAETQPVTDFTASREPSTGYVNLSWSFPANAEGVVIRRGTSAYPARWDEGTGIYNGTGVSFTDETALAGTVYYYSCWAYYGQQIGEENASAAVYAYTNSPPIKPECVLPIDGAEDMKLPFSLTATDFSDPDNDTHQSSRWQVSIDDAFEYASIDRTTPGTTSTMLDRGALVSNTTYYWRVQYRDSAGDWSEWSDAQEFTTETSSGGGGGGCFIATAAFGSPFERHVQVFREFRDRRLLTNFAGRAFVRWYYRHSPACAAIISRNRALRCAARTALMPLYVCIRFLL